MKRVLKVISIALVFAIFLIPVLSCSSGSTETALIGNQEVAVQRGNLTIDITAAGNLSLSTTRDLAFEMAGTVAEVLVEEGDTVTEGQELAKLDASEWEDTLASLEDKVTDAERQLTAKERAVTAAEQQLETKERAVLARERDVVQAGISVKNAEIDLETAQDSYTWPELEVAQADVDEARADLNYALGGLQNGTSGDSSSWQRLVDRFTSVLDAAEDRLNAMLTGADPEQVEIKKQQLAIAQGKLEETRATVTDAQITVEDAQNDIEDALIAVEDAQKAVNEVQEALDEAQSKSPAITAPFDGFITKVNVKGGDEVLKGTVAVQIADPNKFEAEIMVSELDILQVVVGGDASVQVSAAEGISLPAQVTHISPTATIQSGVVNYKVTVEVQTLEEVMPKRQAAMSNFSSDNISSGTLPDRIKQAIAEGRITQEQADEMMKLREQAQVQQWSTAVTLPQNFQLREGLSVTVSIIVAQGNNVLLVPNAAITRQGGKSYVSLVSSDGAIEEREITTGLSDWQYTEVTEGLSEGEKVMVSQGTAITTTTTSQQGSSGAIRIPGMGGFGR